MAHPLLHLVRSNVGALRPYRAPAHQSASIRIDANESPALTSPLDIAALLKEVELERYPDPNATTLRNAIAIHCHAQPEQIVVGSGSDEVIAMLIHAFGAPKAGKSKAKVMYVAPSFVMYGLTAQAYDCDTIAVPLTPDWQIDENALLTAIDQHTPNLLFLASPNNPTGNAFSDTTIERILTHSKDTLVVVDEAYAPYAQRSLASWQTRFSNMALLGTLSKVGFAAIRTGWGILPAELADIVQRVRLPYNLNALSQTIATHVLSHYDHLLANQIHTVINQRTRLFDAFQSTAALHPFKSDANFILARVTSDAHALHAQLLAQGISVKHYPSTDPRLADCLRFTIGSESDNTRLINALSTSARASGKH